MSKSASEYLSSGPRFGEGEVIERIESFRRRRPRLLDDHVTLAHGAGGKASAALVDAVFMEAFRNPLLETLGDGDPRSKVPRFLEEVQSALQS